MPFFIIAAFLAAVVLVIAILAARRGGAHWANSKGLDWVLFLSVFTSFVFTILLSARLATFVSDTNIPIDDIVGSMFLNIGLFLVPVILFVASMLLLVRLIQNIRNPVRASYFTDKENYGQGISTRR